jgi:Tol biopolymer transport system component
VRRALVLVVLLASSAGGGSAADELRQRAFSPEVARQSGEIAYAQSNADLDPCSLDLFVADTSGSNRRVTRNAIAADPAWSPDGRTLAYVGSSHCTGLTSIWLIGRDGTGRRRVVTASSLSRIVGKPVWSPTGRLIAYEDFEPATNDHRVFVIRPDGSDRRQLTRSRDIVSIAGWSRDGRRLAIARPTHDAWEIVAVRVPSGRATTLFSGSSGDGGLALSPDWKHVALCRIRSSGTSDDVSPVYVANVGGGGRRLVTREGDFCEPRETCPCSYDWSPDGRLLAFVDDGIRVVKPDGSGRRRLTKSGAAPVWSPDGRLIAYLGDGEIRLVGRGGSGERRLVRLVGDLFDLAWSPARQLGRARRASSSSTAERSTPREASSTYRW